MIRLSTSIGQASGGEFGLFLTSTMRILPAKNLVTPAGARPEAR